MYQSSEEFYSNWKKRAGSIRDQAPEVAKSFAQMNAALMSDGAVSAKTKELIALGIGLAHHCPPCIRAHAAGCLQEGATREEILEAAGVAVIMAGGPAYIHIPMLVEALDELESKQAK